ncbi:MAG: hypothetical protein JXR61_13660 [Prolixibacteraceae bacterium]|nr:hypothetical protein [Prolixibacteraceae bacterium]
MKRFLLIVSFLIPWLFSFSIENHSIGARPGALSNAYVSISDSWSTFHNQAGIAGTQKINIGFFYQSRFMVEELSLTAGSVIIPVNGGSFGISFFQFGKGSFKEDKYALAYALPISETLNAAIQLDYFTRHLPENDRSKGFATFEAGIIYNPVKKFSLGAHIFNPVNAGIETLQGKEKAPLIFRIGGHYQFDDFVMVVIEAQKSSDATTIIKSGIEFYPVSNLAIRFGVSGKPLNYTAGIGYTVGKLTTDISFGYHGNLGITPAISFQIMF